jgi:hypothetical protein
MKKMPRGHSTKSKIQAPKKKAKEGRPTLYSPSEHPSVARKIIAEGKTHQELSELLGISRSTLDEWRRVHIEFSVAIDLGREDQSDRVERSLLEKAAGYTRKQEKLITVTGPVGTGSQVERHTVEEHYPADTGAAKFWLTNRRKKEWSDKSEVAMTGMEALVARLASARKRTQKAEEVS